MKKAVWMSCAIAAAAAALSFGPRLVADADVDWGLQVQRELNQRSEQLFGVGTPLSKSALGPVHRRRQHERDQGGERPARVAGVVGGAFLHRPDRALAERQPSDPFVRVR